MSSELDDLQITADEIERISGIEVSDSILGGLLWGTYRWPLNVPQRLLSVAVTEVLMLGLFMMLATPIGLAFSRSGSNHQVVQLIVAIALIFWLLRQAWMFYLGYQLCSLMRLLDEVDCYHHILDAVVLLDQLGSVEQLELQVTASLLAALGKTRESLVAALITEKILRFNKGLLSRREALLETIEENLVTLRSLDLQHQAQEYGDILEQALNIGIRVQYEVRKLART